MVFATAAIWPVAYGCDARSFNAVASSNLVGCIIDFDFERVIMRGFHTNGTDLNKLAVQDKYARAQQKIGVMSPQYSANIQLSPAMAMNKAPILSSFPPAAPVLVGVGDAEVAVLSSEGIEVADGAAVVVLSEIDMEVEDDSMVVSVNSTVPTVAEPASVMPPRNPGCSVMIGTVTAVNVASVAPVSSVAVVAMASDVVSSLVSSADAMPTGMSLPETSSPEASLPEPSLPEAALPEEAPQYVCANDASAAWSA